MTKLSRQFLCSFRQLLHWTVWKIEESKCSFEVFGV